MKDRTPDCHLKCLCGKCRTCRSRELRRLVAASKRAGTYVTPAAIPRRVKGLMGEEHEVRGGRNQTIEMRQQVFFARRREAWADRVRAVICG
jgi:hypothetical protein